MASPFRGRWLISTILVAILALSFTHWDLFTSPVWAGLANYKALFTDAKFLKSLANTAEFSVMYVPGVVIISLFVAVLLNRKIHGVGLFRIVGRQPPGLLQPAEHHLAVHLVLGAPQADQVQSARAGAGRRARRGSSGWEATRSRSPMAAPPGRWRRRVLPSPMSGPTRDFRRCSTAG